MNIRYSIVSLLVIFIGLSSSGTSFADPKKPSKAFIRALIQESDLARGDEAGASWHLEVVSLRDDGTEKVQKIKIISKGFKTVTETLFPPNQKGQKLVMLDESMWFTKPGLRKPVPISARQKLLGSASYGDLASTNYAGDYNAEFLKFDTVEGSGQTYVFDLRAKKGRNTTYDHIKYWIDAKRKVGVKAEFYSVSGRLLKEATFEYRNQVNKAEAKRIFISKMEMIDKLKSKNSKTTLTYSNVSLAPIPDSKFKLNRL